MNPMFYSLHRLSNRQSKSLLLPKFCWLLCLWLLSSVGATAQTPPNCPTTHYDNITPINDFTGTGYPAYRFYHRDGTYGNTFYKDETIYSYGTTSDNTCKSPTAAVFRTPNMPNSFTQICTGVNLPIYWTGSNSCEAPVNKTCQKVGPVQYVHSRAQRFQATTSGEFTIPFNNSNGTTVNLTILERYAIYTECGNLAGSYIETGTQNGKKKFVDSDNNVLYYDDTNAQWVVSGSMGIAYSVASTADAPPLTGWQTKAGSGCIGLNIKVVYGEYTPNFTITFTLNNTCLPQYNGVYTLTSIVEGRPVLTGPNNQQIAYMTFNTPSVSKHWQIGNGEASKSDPKLIFYGNSMTVPTCWGQYPNPSSGTTCGVSGDAVTIVLSTERAVLNPVNICVQSLCGNYGGIYTPTKLFNERPDMKDDDNNRLFYWGAGDIAHPEGWYIADADNKFVYYNSSSAESVPTTGWQAFTGDGISCTNNIGVFQNECPPCPTAGSIAYSNASYCKNITEATATITGPTGGAFTSTQGLSIDANSGTINPSISTAGTYTITYSLGGTNGCVLTTATTSVTINDLKTPTVTIDANPSSSITTSTEVTFTATPINGGTAPTYVWKKNDEVISGEGGATYTTTSLADGDKIKVEMTSSDACASPKLATSGEITMTVSCTPPVISIDKSANAICTGAKLNLTANGGSSYSWASSGGTFNSSTNPATFSSNSTGVFSFTVTATGTSTCTASATASVSVNASPTVNINSPSSVCAGKSINLNASSPLPQSAGLAPTITVGDSYTWASSGGTFVSSTNPATFSSSSAGGFSFTVTATNSNSCSATATASVRVNENPSVSISPGTSSLCTGQTLELRASLNTGNSASLTPSITPVSSEGYAWASSGGTFNSSAANATFSSSSAGGFRFTVTATNSNSCSATATASVTVNSKPALSISQSNNQVCAGVSINLSATSGLSNYSWVHSGGTFTSTTNEARFSSGAGGTFTFTVTAGNSTCSNSATASVLVLGVASANPIFAPICALGNPLNLSASGGSSYSWRGPNGFKSSSATPSKAKTVAKDEGIYSVTVSSTLGCTATSTIKVYIGVGKITASSNSTVCKGGTIQLSATSEFGASYKWTKQFSSVVYNVQNPSIPNAQPSDGGVYLVFVTGANGCVVKEEVLVVVSSRACTSGRLASEEEVEGMEMEVHTYPNPTSKLVTVEVKLAKPSSLKLNLYNATGNTLNEWNLSEESTIHRKEIDLSVYKDGLYLIQAQSKDGKQTKRVMKIE